MARIPSSNKIGFIVLACIGLIIALQQSQWCIQLVEQFLIETVQQQTGLTLCTTVRQCNLLLAKINLADSTISDPHNQWYVKSNGTTLRWSWFWLVMRGKLNISATVDDIAITSKAKNGIPIFVRDLIILLRQKGKPGVTLRRLAVQHATCHISDDSLGTAHLEGTLLLQTEGSTEVLTIKAPQVHYTNDHLAQEIGPTNAIIKFISQPNSQIQATIHCQQLVDPISCSIIDSDISTKISAAWKSCTASATINQQDSGSIDATISGPVQDINHFYPIPTWLSEAMVSAQIHLPTNKMIAGTATATLARAPWQLTTDLAFQDIYTAAGNYILTKGESIFRGTYKFNGKEHKCCIEGTNPKELKLPMQRYWHLPSKGFSTHCTIDWSKNLAIQLQAKGQISHNITQAKQSLKLQSNFGDGAINLTAHAGDYTLTAKNSSVLAGNVRIDNKKQECAGVTWLSKPISNIPVIDIWSNIDLLKSIINDAWIDYLQGTGVARLNIIAQENKWRFTGKFGDGSLFIANTYNMINQIECTGVIDLFNKTGIIERGTISLHKGTLSVTDAFISVDDSGQLNKIELPINMDHCLVTWKKLYGVLCGNITLHKKNNISPWNCSGLISIHKGQITHNILSPALQEAIMRLKLLQNPQDPDAILDLKIKSKRPIPVKTEQISTQASIDLQVTGTTGQPKAIGDIHLHGGQLHFPYQALAIDHGNVQFTNQELRNPLISLRAHGTIKRYQINFSLNGTVTKPHIVLQSTPVLTQNQISALLVAGSTDILLNTIAPALFVENMKQYILGSVQESSSAHQRLMRLLKPLQKIKLTPHIQEKQGKKTLTGGVDIELSKRLHASIQKDLTSDASPIIDIDYQMLDDVSIHAIKDDRGDVGAEIEMKWKF